MSLIPPHRIACRNELERRIIDELPVAYLEVDAQGVIVCMNRAARQMHGPELGEVTGKSIWDLMPLEERETSRREFDALMQSGVTPPVILRSIYTSGEFRVQQIHRRLIYSDEGQPVGVRSITFDVTEMETARKSAQQSKDWMESILESMPDAVLVTDALGFIRYLNPAGETLIGCKREQIMGKIVEEALPLVSYQSTQDGELNFRLTVDRQWSGTIVVLDHAKNELALEISTSPLLDKDNQFTIGVVAIMRRSAVAGASVQAGEPLADQACSSAA